MAERGASRAGALSHLGVLDAEGGAELGDLGHDALGDLGVDLLDERGAGDALALRHLGVLGAVLTAQTRHLGAQGNLNLKQFIRR